MTIPSSAPAVDPQPISPLADAGAKVLGGLRVAFGLAGLVTLVVGVLILVWPGRTAVVGTGILAVYAVVVGLIYLAVAILAKNRGGWSRIGHGVLAALFVASGISAFSNLQATTAVLAVFLSVMVGVLWLAEGVVSLLTVGRSDAKIWTVVFAVISILAGIALLSSPLWSAVLLWWLIGISLVALGLVQIVRAVTFGKPAGVS